MRAKEAALCIGFVLADLPADADDQFSASLTLTSDYRFRGLSQDARQITPQVEVDWADADGWSLGTFASKVDFHDHENTSVEWDMSGGKRLEFLGTALDLNAYYYAYPNHRLRPGGTPYSTFEAIAKLSREWTGFTATVAASWSPNFLANGESWDLECGGSRELTSWLSLSGHLGRQWEKRWNSFGGSGFPYPYGDIGLNAKYGPWAFDIRYVATGLSRTQCVAAVGGRDWCEAGLILSINYIISATPPA